MSAENAKSTRWKMVPLEPTAEIIAGAAIAAWPTASPADIALARRAAPLVLMQMDLAPGASVDLIAGMLATMAPAYRAMLAAAPPVPLGYKLVPIAPTEEMVVRGFEAWPDPSFNTPEEWSAYEAMTGCEQAAHRARLCWAAMLAAAPVAP